MKRAIIWSEPRPADTPARSNSRCSAHGPSVEKPSVAPACPDTCSRTWLLPRGPVHRALHERAVRVADDLPVDVEHHLRDRRVHFERLDLHLQLRGARAAAEIDVADHRRLLERRQHRGGRRIGVRIAVREAPRVRRRIDDRLQVLLEEVVHQAAGREHLREIRRRDVARARRARTDSGPRSPAGRSRRRSRRPRRDCAARRSPRCRSRRSTGRRALRGTVSAGGRPGAASRAHRTAALRAAPQRVVGGRQVRVQRVDRLQHVVECRRLVAAARRERTQPGEVVVDDLLGARGRRRGRTRIAAWPAKICDSELRASSTLSCARAADCAPARCVAERRIACERHHQPRERRIGGGQRARHLDALRERRGALQLDVGEIVVPDLQVVVQVELADIARPRGRVVRAGNLGQPEVQHPHLLAPVRFDLAGKAARTRCDSRCACRAARLPTAACRSAGGTPVKRRGRPPARR